MSDPAKIFSEAVTRLKIKSIDAPRLFDVTRQTFSNWMHGKTQPPPCVFTRIVEMENAADRRINARIAEVREIVAKVQKRNSNSPEHADTDWNPTDTDWNPTDTDWNPTDTDWPKDDTDKKAEPPSPAGNIGCPSQGTK